MQNVPTDGAEGTRVADDMIMESWLPGEIGFDGTNPFGAHRFELIDDGPDGTGWGAVQ